MSDRRRLIRQLKRVCKDLNNPIKNKYPFAYLAVLEAYVDVAIKNATLPFGINPDFYDMPGCEKNKDITFLEFAMVRVGDIKIKKFNPARADAIDGDTISGIENIISTGAYCGWKYVPPVINERGELIAGYHRYEGHLGVWGLDGYLWVAICKFKNEAAEFNYNELENQISLEFDKKLASYDDVLSSTRYGLQRKFYTLEDVPERVNKKRLKGAEKRKIIETIQIENGVEVDLHKTVRRPEVFSEYAAMPENIKTNKELDFVASISQGDNIINNGRILAGVLCSIIEGTDMNIALSVKKTPSLKFLDEVERVRLQKEVSPEFAVEFCRKVVNSADSGIMGKIFHNFPEQYENDEWKLDIEAENVKN